MRIWYRHREDRLESRVEEAESGRVHEKFGPGRERSLQSHSYSVVHSHSRAMTFYHK